MVRNEEDQHRTFGCPTVRTDIPKKKLKSVADHQNYGDEPEAVDVLFPSSHTEIGIDENDFSRPRSKAYIRQLFASIGHTFKTGKFNTIFRKAMEMTPKTA